MSQRCRLPNSLRWRAVGWMEMGLSQADAARRLNVSRSVVQRLWDQYQSEDSLRSEDLFQADHELQHLQKSARRRRTTTVPQLVADHFSSIRKKNLRYYGAKSSSQCRSVCKKTSCVRFNGRQRRNRLAAGQENMFLGRSNNEASVLFTDESRFTMESDSGRLLIWREQRTRYHQSNTVERHSYRGGGILVWAGSRSSNLTCMCSMEEPYWS
ncbi:uncharacterized protein TNCV_1762881 [Trichonephila clavipes]|nr:uncharacterized protein TNCV_1762881 [Trichonephila clavipes]